MSATSAWICKSRWSCFSELFIFFGQEHSHKVFGSMGSRYGVVVRDTLLARDFYTSGRKWTRKLGSGSTNPGRGSKVLNPFYVTMGKRIVNYASDVGFISLSCIQKKLDLNQPKSLLSWKHTMRSSFLSLQRLFSNVCRIIQQLMCPGFLLV
jgi:hypothetical protein